MDFFKRKWINAIILMLIVIVAVLLAVSLVRLTPDPKNVGGFRFKLGGKTPVKA